MGSPRGSLALFVAASVPCVAIACGPSVQLRYEGDVRFEHCHRLDHDPGIVPSHRRACWRDWLSRWTRGQTDDRVAYAHRRLAQLDRGDTSTLVLGDGDSAPGDEEALAAHVPPPAVLREPAPPAASSAPPPLAPEVAPPPAAPAEECTRGCERAWQQCQEGCPPAGQGCPGCTGTYRRCVRRCVR